MRWVTYRAEGGEERVGLLEGGAIHGLERGQTLLGLLGDDGARLSRAGEQARSAPVEVVSLAEARLMAPIPTPPSLRDALGFLDHIRNIRKGISGSAALEPEWSWVPTFYFCNPASVIGPHDDVPRSPGSRRFDFELEVGAIVGLPGGNLRPEEAERHIIGYTLFCDWSARDLQQLDMKLGVGQAKGKDGATTLGPFLVTADELSPHRAGNSFHLELSAWVNDRKISQGFLDQMDWSFAEILAYASRGTRLAAGDVIGSGTVPSGCLLEHFALQEAGGFPGWLQPGDVVRLRGEQLGEIEQRVVEAPPLYRLHNGR
jgi:2-keto-4-pentenoate hydratase/2-oxohepta-3-ene-1,7-dioic acid hydratase in catechol pathway